MLRVILCVCLFVLATALPCMGAPQKYAPQSASALPPVLSAFTAAHPDIETQEMQQLQRLWANVLARHDPEKAFGNAIQAMPSPVLTQWKNLSKRMPSWTAVEKLQNINGFFNRWRSIDDLKNYGTEEYWATPEEFLEKGGGDCEDFAIIKYLALRYFGWPEQNLWLLLGKKHTVGSFHAVLAARTGERKFILDNLSRPPYLLIPEEKYMRNFTPFYAMNCLGIWLLTAPGTPAVP